MTTLIKADENECIHCGRCAIVCPVAAIGLTEDKFPIAVEDSFRVCINCGFCVDICPTGALHHHIRKRSVISPTRAAIKRYQVLIKRTEGSTGEK